MGSRLPLYLILAGILLVLSSCVPVANTLYRLANPDPPESFDLLPDRFVKTAVPAGDAETVSLSLELVLAAVPPTYAVRYTYQLQSSRNTVQHGAGVISDTSTGPTYTRERQGGDLKVVRRFPVAMLAGPDGSLTLDVAVDEPEPPGAELVRARMLLYRNPPRFRVSFLGSVVLWTLGILLALIGAIQWARSVAATRPGDAVGADAESSRLWCMLCHLSALAGYVLPFGHILFPVAIWMSRRDRLRGVDEAGRESLNFQLTVTLFALIGVLLSVVFVGLILLFVVIVFHVTMTLRAALNAQRGETVRYPLNIRIIRQAE